MDLTDYNERAARLGVLPEYRGTVTSIHGINTLGHWQREISTELQDAALRYHQINYGIIRLKMLWWQQSVAEMIVEALHEQEDKWPSGPHGVIAHSFGTLCLGHALQRNPGLRVLKRICLFGAILPRDFPWRELRERHQYESVLNETCRGDKWARLARYLPLKTGPSGCDGFLDAEPYVYNCPTEWTGHSGLGSRAQCRGTWLPFLLKGALPPSCRQAEAARNASQVRA